LNPDNKRTILIGFTGAYAIFLYVHLSARVPPRSLTQPFPCSLLGVLGIALTASTSRNIDASIGSVKTFADATPVAIRQINSDLDTVQADLFSLVDTVSDQLTTYSFSQVNTLIDNIALLTVGLRGGIFEINGSLANITVYYENLVGSCMDFAIPW
jgi:hypothetical protein